MLTLHEIEKRCAIHSRGVAYMAAQMPGCKPWMREEASEWLKNLPPEELDALAAKVKKLYPSFEVRPA